MFVWKLVSAIILLMTLGMFLSICAKLIRYDQSFKWAESSCSMVINHYLFPHFKHDFGWNLEVTIYVNLTRRVSEQKHTEKWNGHSCMILEWGWKQGHRVVLDILLFLGHTWWDDLVAAFHNGLFIEETNIQISMDGSNTNLKLLSEVQNECQKNKLSSLIDIGSRNLHLIHWAFKTGSQKSSWDLHKILKRAFKLLNSHVRWEDYFNLTGSEEYPL